jgi:multidrug resistance protein MdtO
MASNASTFTEPAPAAPTGFSTWFGQFLKSELAPYPGRGVTVARVVIAATLTMILTMTFRIPGGALGATYVFLIARDSLYATLNSVWTIAVSYAAGLLFLLIGAGFFADDPMARFLWFAGSLLAVFFALRTVENFSAATGFTLLVVNALPTWNLRGTSEAHLETTLWLTLSVCIGAAVTVATEAVFRFFHAKDELIEGLDNRWSAVIRLLHCYVENRPIPAAVQNELAQYAVTGVSGLRRILARAVRDRLYREQMTAVVGLTGRLTDIASTLAEIPYQLIEGDSQRASELIRYLEEIRQSISAKQAPLIHELSFLPSGIPLRAEMERTVTLIPKVFSGAEPLEAYIPSVLDNDSAARIFVRDAFSNYEYVKFALRGCLAATLCYFVYSILDWSGLATSVTTCVLTALTNIGASRQKQLLRLTGAVAGGFIFGIGVQVFILPGIDSIAQFTVMFAAVSAVGAWFATSSSRLSYFGLQFVLAFYLIHLQEFTVQTSLAIARDRVIGILLGLSAMWLVFDRIWAKQAAEEMADIFTANVRLIAQLARQSTAGEPAVYIKQIRKLRNTISSNFQAVNAQADAIPFEFGRDRNRHMEARAHIRRWQPALRTLYLMEVASMQHRVFGADSEFPKSLLDAQDRFHQACAGMLDAMADRLESKNSIGNVEELEAAVRQLAANVTEAARVGSGFVLARAEGLVTLARQISSLTEELFGEVAETHCEVFSRPAA